MNVWSIGSLSLLGSWPVRPIVKLSSRSVIHRNNACKINYAKPVAKKVNNIVADLFTKDPLVFLE